MREDLSIVAQVDIEQNTIDSEAVTLNPPDPYRLPVISYTPRKGGPSGNIYRYSRSEVDPVYEPLFNTSRKILRKNIEKVFGTESGNISYELLMCGTRPETAKPALVVKCAMNILENVRKVLAQEGLLKRCHLRPRGAAARLFRRMKQSIGTMADENELTLGLEIYGCGTVTRPPVRTELRGRIPDASDIEASRHASDHHFSSLSGAKINSIEGDSSATLSGVVQIGAKSYGLTTSHPFRHGRFKKFRNSAMYRIGDMKGWTVPVEILLQGCDQTVQTKVWIPSSVAFTSTIPNLDWALVLLDATILHENDTEIDTSISEWSLVSTYALKHPGWEPEVSILSFGDEPKRGVLLQGIAYYTHRSTAEVAVWNLALDEDRPVIKGDSGSLAIDADSGVAYGYIVARDTFGRAEIIPLNDALHQISSLTGFDHVTFTNGASLAAKQNCIRNSAEAIAERQSVPPLISTAASVTIEDDRLGDINEGEALDTVRRFTLETTESSGTETIICPSSLHDERYSKDDTIIGIVDTPGIETSAIIDGDDRMLRGASSAQHIQSQLFPRVPQEIWIPKRGEQNLPHLPRPMEDLRYKFNIPFMHSRYRREVTIDPVAHMRRSSYLIELGKERWPGEYSSRVIKKTRLEPHLPGDSTAKCLVFSWRWGPIEIEEPYNLRKCYDRTIQKPPPQVYQGNLSRLKELEVPRKQAERQRPMRAMVSILNRSAKSMAARELFDKEYTKHGTPRGQLDTPKESREEKNLRYDMAKQIDELIQEIRTLPNFDRFLLVPSEDELASITVYGFIVIINVSQYGCYASIIEKKELRNLELPLLRLEEIRIRASESTNIETLEWLWHAVASPILDALNLLETPKRVWPRIWWIPTGPLVRFPIHSAGSYFDDGTYDTVMDRAISSYSSSLKVILNAHRNLVSVPTKSINRQSMVLVGMEQTPGYASLQFASKEIEALTTIGASMQLEVKQPISNRRETLTAISNCKIFHFAGHGYTNSIDPSQSALILSDGSLTVGNIFDVNLRHNKPFLAYLSACGTGQVKNDELVDEGLHLISAYQLAGFQHVIGTLWEVNDESCVDVARKTYGGIQIRGLSSDSVAEALHFACRELRTQWVAENDVRRTLRHSIETDKRLTNTTQSRSTENEKRDARDVESLEDVPLYWVPYVHFGT